jgi:hypothetical protein
MGLEFRVQGFRFRVLDLGFTPEETVNRVVRPDITRIKTLQSGGRVVTARGRFLHRWIHRGSRSVNGFDDFIGKEYQFQKNLAMKFASQHDLYQCH